MHPKEFRDHWKLTNAELARLIGGYTVDGVQHWFRSSNPAPVPAYVENRLADLHIRFLNWQQEESLLPPHEREIWELAKQRRKSI